MRKNQSNISKIRSQEAVPGFIESLRNLNFGIVLIAIYFLLEFGAVQDMFEFPRQLHIPYILVLISSGYSILLILKKPFILKSRVSKSFIFFCLLIFVHTIVMTKQPVVKMDIAKLFIGYLAHYILIVGCVRTRFQFILLIDIWLACVVLASFHGIMQGGLIYGSRWLKDENHISLIAATALPFAFIFFMAFESKARKIIYALCMVLYVGVNVVAASRGGALSLFCAAFFCWLPYRKQFKTLLIMATAIILVIMLAPPIFFSELETLKQGTKEGTAKSRIYTWGIAIDMFKDHPIIGVGIMNYPEYFLSYDYLKKWRGHRQGKRVAHSTPLQWLAETGIVGMVIFILLQKALFKNWSTRRQITKTKGLKIYKDLTDACGIAQLAFWVGGAFLSLLPYPFYWVLIPFSESWKIICIDYIDSATE